MSRTGIAGALAAAGLTLVFALTGCGAGKDSLSTGGGSSGSPSA